MNQTNRKLLAWRRIPPPAGKTLRLTPADAALLAHARELRRRVFSHALMTLFVAVALSLGLALVRSPGDSDRALSLWWEILASGSADAGLDPAAVTVGMVSLAATIFVSFSLKATATSASRSSAAEGARAIMLDDIATCVVTVGGVLSWMSIQWAGGADSRGTGILLPVGAALLCSALAAVAEQSADSRRAARADFDLKRGNLHNALVAYERRMASHGLAPGDATRQALWRTYPWRVTVLVVFASVAPCTIVALLASSRSTIAVLVAMVFLAVSLLSLVVLWIFAMADRQVQRVSRGRGGWSGPGVAFQCLIALGAVSGVLAGMSSPLRGGMMALFACVAPLAGHLTTRDVNYLSFVAVRMRRQVENKWQEKSVDALAPRASWQRHVRPHGVHKRLAGKGLTVADTDALDPQPRRRRL